MIKEILLFRKSEPFQRVLARQSFSKQFCLFAFCEILIQVLHHTAGWNHSYNSLHIRNRFACLFQLIRNSFMSFENSRQLFYELWELQVSSILKNTEYRQHEQVVVLFDIAYFVAAIWLILWKFMFMANLYDRLSLALILKPKASRFLRFERSKIPSHCPDLSLQIYIVMSEFPKAACQNNIPT